MSPADIRAIKRRQGQVKPGKPGVFPKYRIGSLVGTDKSKRTVNPTKVDSRVVKTHYDYNHQVTQNQVAYFGFQDAGSCQEQLTHGCLALAQMIYQRIGVHATHQDIEAKMLTHLYKIDSIVIHFESVNEDGTSVDTTTEITAGITTGAYKTLLTLAVGIREAILEASNSGGWPTILELVQGTGANKVTYQRYDLTNVMIHFSAMQKYKYQNITPSTGVVGESTVNDVNANPLSGRIYQFKHSTPRLRPLVKEDDHAQYPGDNLAKIEDLQAPGGLEQGALACEAFRVGTVYSGALKLGFKQPPKAVSLFENTTHEDKFYMPPGGYKQMIKNTSVVMNFKRFCIATVIRGPALNANPYIGLNNDTRVPRIGTSTMWAVEPAVRTNSNEAIKLIVNRELWLSAKAVVGNRRQAVRAKTACFDGADFGS